MDPTELNDAPTSTPVADPTVTPTAPVPTADLVANPAVTALMEKARKQERDKLYAQMEKLKSDLRTAEATRVSVTPAAPPPAAEPSQFEVLQRQMAEQTAAVNSLLTQQAADRQAKEVAAAREEILREKNIPAIMQHRVVGTNREQLEEAAINAVLEYNDMMAHFVNQHAPQPQAQPVTPQVVALPVSAAQPPHGAPVITSAAPAPANSGAAGLTEAEFKYLTSEKGMRSGEYQRRRNEIMQYMRTGGAPPVGTQLPMRPLGSQVAQQPQQQPYVAPFQATAPQPNTQYIQLPDGSFQPLGTPQGPAHRPNQPAPAPAAPAAAPQFAAPQPDGPVNVLSMSPEQIKAAAGEAARRALTSVPDGVRAHPAAGRTAGEYALRPGQNVPTAQALAQGQNPMVRQG